jgi:hypothetical protein
MIIWVSSYPRSGNSLAKAILRDVFLLPGTSQYSAKDLSKLAAEARPSSGGRTHTLLPQFSYAFLGPWEEFRAAAHAAPHDVYIKTHAQSDDDSRAIYVVRDPRAALVSYFHFMTINYPKLAATPEDVIRGSVGFGSWTAHLESWQPDRRAGTLLLRYEDMIDRPDTAISALAAFLGTPPLRPWRNRFRDLHELQPSFFRSGSNARNMSELSVSQHNLIRALHGPWMRRLGYDPG